MTCSNSRLTTTCAAAAWLADMMISACCPTGPAEQFGCCWAVLAAACYGRPWYHFYQQEGGFRCASLRREASFFSFCCLSPATARECTASTAPPLSQPVASAAQAGPGQSIHMLHTAHANRPHNTAPFAPFLGKRHKHTQSSPSPLPPKRSNTKKRSYIPNPFHSQSDGPSPLPVRGAALPCWPPRSCPRTAGMLPSHASGSRQLRPCRRGACTRRNAAAAACRAKPARRLAPVRGERSAAHARPWPSLGGTRRRCEDGGAGDHGPARAARSTTTPPSVITPNAPLKPPSCVCPPFLQELLVARHALSQAPPSSRIPKFGLRLSPGLFCCIPPPRRGGSGGVCRGGRYERHHNHRRHPRSAGTVPGALHAACRARWAGGACMQPAVPGPP